jgi:hypothetical protein
MNDKPRRGAPANAFKDYPGLNEAYLIARDNVNLIIGDWNRKNPGNEVALSVSLLTARPIYCLSSD